jgi:hypothetical protein
VTDREKIIVEALKQTELHLEDLQGVAAAAEARAFQFASMAVLVATLATALASQMPHSPSIYFGSIGLVISAFWAIFAVRPRVFHIRGHRWADWKPHVDENDKYDEVVISQAEENDERIRVNFEILKESAAHFSLSFAISFFSLLVAIIGQCVAISDGQN